MILMSSIHDPPLRRMITPNENTQSRRKVLRRLAKEMLMMPATRATPQLP